MAASAASPFFPEHHQSGLALFTPAAIYSGRHVALQKTRQAKLDGYYAKHPERFVKGPPLAPELPATVAINPDKPIAPPSHPQSTPRQPN